MAHPVSTQEVKEYAKREEVRDRGLISAVQQQKRIAEVGGAPARLRVAELRMRRAQRCDATEEEETFLLGLQPSRGCAQAKKVSQTPKAKRVKVSACTPEVGMEEARIRSGLSACSKHPNGHQ